MSCSIARTALAIALTVACAVAHAQLGDPPDVRPGDRWRFVVYYAVPSTVPNRVWIFNAVDSQGISGTENGEPLHLTRELNPRDSPAATQWDAQPLRFPLRVGDQWRYVSRIRWKDNGSQSTGDTHVRVEAWERVRVVAGEFGAFRLRATSNFEGTSYGGKGKLRGESTTTYWYAPDARAIVKWTTRTTYRGESTIELVDYALSARK